MLLEFLNVTKEYKDTKFSLRDISFSLDEKEIVGIVGKNGTGKSTILKMTNRLVLADGGDIKFKGKSILSLQDKELRSLRKEIVYVFQNSNLLENKTVYYHLSLVYKLEKKKIDDEEIDNIIKLFEIERLKDSYIRHLSGGQKQKVAIAMAILQKPSIVLCDEITSQLDWKAENEIIDLLEKIVKSSDLSILLVSHNLQLLRNFCDKVLVLDQNTIVESIKPQKSNLELSRNYLSEVRRSLNG